MNENTMITIGAVILGWLLSFLTIRINEWIHRATLEIEITEKDKISSCNQLIQIKIKCTKGVAKGLYITMEADFSLKNLSDETRVQTIYSVCHPKYEVMYGNMKDLILAKGHNYIEILNIIGKEIVSKPKILTITVSSDNAKPVILVKKIKAKYVRQI